jgi:hypothetical protein
MIKLRNATHLRDYLIRLEFSDDSWGDYDLAPLVARDGPMIAPLKDRSFFSRFYIDEGALAWPNGFDLSPDALHQRLAEKRLLQRPRAAE